MENQAADQPSASAAAGPFTLRLIADVNDLAAIRRFVRETITQAGGSTQAVDDLVLAVDELATNIIDHGYRGQPDVIEIVLRREADVAVVQLRDEAPPFDPTQWPEPDTTLPWHSRPAGGLGVFLARRRVDTMTYQRTADRRNEVTLTKKLS
jgi:serine/threonine-protein kinase RsbW